MIEHVEHNFIGNVFVHEMISGGRGAVFVVCLLKELSDCLFGHKGFSAMSDSRTQKGREMLCLVH